MNGSPPTLPRGWSSVALGDILPIRYGKGLTESVRNNSGGVPVVGSSGLVGTHDTAVTAGPAIILGRKGNVGAVHYSPTPCWPIDTVYYTIGTFAINLRLGAHLLRYLALNRLDRSTTVPGLSRDDYVGVIAPLPPLAEQSRIVEGIESYLSRLDEAEAALERVQRNLKRYRAAVLQAAVSGRLVPTEAELARAEGRDYEPASDLLKRILAERRRRWEEAGLTRLKAAGKAPRDDRWKERCGEPVPPDAGLPILPRGWCWASLDQLALDVEGGTAETAGDSPTARPVLRSSAVRQGRVDLVDVRYLPTLAPGATLPRVLAPGDLLITRLSGSLEYVGNCALVPDFDFGRIEFPDRLFRAHLSPHASPRYLQHCFAAPDLRRPLERTAKSTAGHQRISLSDLRPFAIPLPPFGEQSRIAAEMERLLAIADGAEGTAHQSERRCERLRQSILKWAFEGKLVDQDPNDEPASVLIERIRADRAADAAAKPGRRPRGPRGK